jgi:hypothetical protein
MNFKAHFGSEFTGKSYTDQTNKKRYRFIVSSSAIDRAGDSINVDGIDLAEYERNPIVFYNHDWNTIIGESIISKEDGFLYGDVWFDEITEISRQTKQQIDVGTLKTASIGLEVFETNTREMTDLEKALNKRSWIKKVRTIDKSSMFEWSVVPLPANTEAERKRLETKKEIDMELELKAGAKISRKNLEHLQNAISEINAVISAMDVDETADKTMELESEIETKNNTILELESKILELESKENVIENKKITLDEFLKNKELF